MKKSKSLFSEIHDLSPSAGKNGRRQSSRSPNVNRSELKELVGEVRPDDGINPREEARRRRRALGDARPGFSHGEHKQEQVLAQVQSALELALQAATSPILNSLEVRDVARQGGSLVVVVIPRDPGQPVDVLAAAKALEAASSMLSREVASAITRKETPKLNFVVLPAGTEKIDE